MHVIGDYIKVKHGYAFKGDYISTEDNGIVLVTPGNFAIGGGFKEQKCKFFTSEYPDEYVLKEDDLIVTMTDLSKAVDTLGYSALVPFSEKRVYLHNQRIGLVQILSNEIDKHYLYWYMRTPKYQRTIAATSSGSTVHHTSPDRICEIEIEVPKMEVQKKIAKFLDDIEAKININENINRNLLEQLDALYFELSTREAWEYVAIGELAEKIAMGPFGSNIKVSTFVESGIPIISGNHLRGHFLEEPSYNYITEEHAEKLKNSVVYPKDVIFTHAGNIGQVAMIPRDCEYERYVISQRQFYLRCNLDRVLPEYITLFFHSDEGQHELLSYANQVGVPSIAQPATNLKKIQVPLPSIDIQKEWIAVVEPMIDLYQKTNKENKRLVSLRDSLLPKLMSGELDVSVLDI